MNIPQDLDHGWLVTDPAPDRHLFLPGTHDYAFVHDGESGPYGEPIHPTLPGAARAYVEGVLPLHSAWMAAIAAEADERAKASAPIVERKESPPGPDGMTLPLSRWRTVRVPDYQSPYYYGGHYVWDVIDRYVGPFPNPYPGDQLRSWATGHGTVAQWAREVSDATDPGKSRTSRRAAGRNAVQLQPAASAQWDQFRTGLDAWATDAQPWIEGAKPKPPAPKPRRSSWR